MHAVFVYSLETGKITQITDGMSDALSPKFDKGGKYLYFTASTDIGLVAGHDMSAFDHPVTRSVYVVVLKKGVASPLAPESDEEKPEKKPDADAAKESSGDKATADKPKGSAEEKDKEKDKEKPKEPPKVEIDFDGISQRILAMPIPAKNYFGLHTGKGGRNLPDRDAAVLSHSWVFRFTVYKFTFKTRKTDKLVEGISGFAYLLQRRKDALPAGPGVFHQLHRCAASAGQGDVKDCGHGSLCDPPRRVEANLPRGLADRT